MTISVAACRTGQRFATIPTCMFVSPQLIDTLGIESMHLIGWSMGGLIVTRFAAEHPASVASLTLISPGLFLDCLGFEQRLSRLPGMHRLIAWRVGDVIDRLDKAHLRHPDQFPDYNKRAREH